MNKSKRTSPRDRLSELPNSLIFEIFWQLPMREVVRTSLLSQRRKNLWTTAPSLNFDESKNRRIDAETIGEFVARATTLWRGNKIVKFKIDFSTQSDDYSSLYSWVNSLVAFAAENGVEELAVDVPDLYWAPQCLYSCSSIKRLYVKGWNLGIHKYVCWDELKYLCFDGYVLSQDSVDKVLCGSPKLDILKLRFIESHSDLSIRSTSLTSLYVHKYLYDDGPSRVTELRISTPKLERLQLIDVPYSKICTSDTPLLTYAKLIFDVPSYYWHNVMFYWSNFVEETLRQVLPTIQNVRRLVLSDWCIKALGDMKNKNMVSPFPNVKRLTLYGRFEEYERIVPLLEIFPELKKLILRSTKGRKGCYGNYERGLVKFGTIFRSSFLQQLRSISVTCSAGEGFMFSLIRILLKYASKLEKMVCRFEETLKPSDCLVSQRASHLVLAMPRSSPNVEFIFL